MVEFLHSKNEALSSSPSTAKKQNKTKTSCRCKRCRRRVFQGWGQSLCEATRKHGMMERLTDAPSALKT
jgi:hypothetical protein